MKTEPFGRIDAIDTHVHLDAIIPVEPAMERAKAAGVHGIVAVGLNLSSNIRILELAGRFPEMVFPAIGYHPWFIVDDEIESTLQFIDEHLKACIALGEVGLDYKVKVRKSLQIAVFKEVLDLARKYQKPVNIHSRYSFERARAMAVDAGVSKAVFHWYSGPPDILDKIIDDGYFISATPALSYSERHRAAIEKAPLTRILVETDAPEKYQGNVSEPATLIETLVHLSRIKNIPFDETARITTDNAEFFYGIKREGK